MTLQILTPAADDHTLPAPILEQLMDCRPKWASVEDSSVDKGIAVDGSSTTLWLSATLGGDVALYCEDRIDAHTGNIKRSLTFLRSWESGRPWDIESPEKMREIAEGFLTAADAAEILLLEEDDRPTFVQRHYMGTDRTPGTAFLICECTKETGEGNFYGIPESVNAGRKTVGDVWDNSDSVWADPLETYRGVARGQLLRVRRESDR